LRRTEIVVQLPGKLFLIPVLEPETEKNFPVSELYVVKIVVGYFHNIKGKS
jgi:hypothetical protein